MKSAEKLDRDQNPSNLIREGNTEKLPLKQVDGVWVFDLPPEAPRVTALQVRQFLDGVT